MLNIVYSIIYIYIYIGQHKQIRKQGKKFWEESLTTREGNSFNVADMMTKNGLTKHSFKSFRDQEGCYTEYIADFENGLMDTIAIKYADFTSLLLMSIYIYIYRYIYIYISIFFYNYWWI